MMFSLSDDACLKVKQEKEISNSKHKFIGKINETNNSWMYFHIVSASSTTTSLNMSCFGRKCALNICPTPAGIWCQNDVVSTSMRRNHVASTLIRRHFRTKCPLGRSLKQPAHPHSLISVYVVRSTDGQGSKTFLCRHLILRLC